LADLFPDFFFATLFFPLLALLAALFGAAFEGEAAVAAPASPDALGALFLIALLFPDFLAPFLLTLLALFATLPAAIIDVNDQNVFS